MANFEQLRNDEVLKNLGIAEALEELGLADVNPGVSTGLNWWNGAGDPIDSFSPNDNYKIATINQGNKDDYEKVMTTAAEAFKTWRMIPAPQRGEIVRQMGNALRQKKEALGKLVSYEMGKIYQEGLGEVQEMIDICDFAVGQSRQLYGFTMHSERAKHRMYDQYHPLGIVGVVSSFNFPVAVWAWNTMLALVAGDVVVWKPSSRVLLSAVASQTIMADVLKENNVPEGVINLVASSSKYLGKDFFADPRLPLISFTGSTYVGKIVGEIVGKRLGKAILELGGNNAIIITPDADLDMAIRAIVFGAVGTAGQRCTSTRRLIIHESVYDEVKNRLLNAYEQVSKKIGHALKPDTLVGPLIAKGSVQDFTFAVEKVKEEGGKVIFGGNVLEGPGYESGCYVVPALAEAENHYNIVQEETFAPLLYLIKYDTFEQALAIHNGVPQGLSSAIFSRNMLETEAFLSHEGSDCGIANVNIGTSGAEIGGAFGGEKDTGGGRESGSDAWKTYMRRQTNTINFGTSLPLAQGIEFNF